MKPERITLTLICLLAFFFFSSCDKEKRNNGEVPGPPEEPGKGKFDEAPFRWDYRFSTAAEDDLFIGDLYISVNNRYMVTKKSKMKHDHCRFSDSSYSCGICIAACRETEQLLLSACSLRKDNFKDKRKE